MEQNRAHKNERKRPSYQEGGGGGEEESGTSQNSQLQHMDGKTENFKIQLSSAGNFLIKISENFHFTHFLFIYFFPVSM